MGISVKKLFKGQTFKTDNRKTPPDIVLFLHQGVLLYQKKVYVSYSSISAGVFIFYYVLCVTAEVPFSRR